MVGSSDDDRLTPLSGGLRHDLVDALDLRAGRVIHRRARALHGLKLRTADAVGSDDDRRALRDLLRSVRDREPLGAQVLHNVVVMDGRDIGTVVLPDAGLKIFLSASAECRAQRRWRQLQEKGIQEPYADVLRELEQRDYDDTHRAIAPLKAAPDAVHIDTSELTLEQSIDAVCAAIRTRFGLEADA